MRFSVTRRAWRMSGLVTGLVLVAGSAQAQATSNNDAVVEQLGRDNSARIEQAGGLNRAGADGNPMIQDGIFNDLDILQNGFGNTIGLGASGLVQIGRENTVTIFNRIGIVQQADDNTIESVQQISRGSVVNGANSLTIRQAGDGEHIVETARQEQLSGQAAQFADITQEGRGNRIALIDQFANSVAQNEPNRITVVMRGVGNGTEALTGYADIPVTSDNGLIQEGGTVDGRSNGNFIDLLIVGDGNGFGVRQAGRMNSVGFITISGNENQLGLRQDGTENDISLAPIEGNDNIIGVDQLGTNTARIDLDTIAAQPVGTRSDGNEILVTQFGTNTVTVRVAGDTNDFTVNQGFDGSLGGNNTAEILLNGDNNLGRLTQRGDNSFVLSVVGSDNNNVGGFTGDAATGMSIPGEFRQAGAGNDARISVTGEGNRFASRQNGTENTLSATVNGNANQFSLSQNGIGNIARILQSGHDNNVRVIQ